MLLPCAHPERFSPGTEIGTMNVPPHNSIVRFTRPPAGSYAKPGVEYRVTHEGKRTVWLDNMATGSGTFDSRGMYNNAQWVLA